MKKFQSFFSILQWKLTFLFLIAATIALFFYQFLDIIGPRVTTYPEIFLFYLLRAFSISLIIYISIHLYLYRFRCRIHQLMQAVNNWCKGDLSFTIHDSGKDDIAQLTRSLDRLKQKFYKIVEIQVEQARSNERNRLARELHDTVKQQLFALAFQINIAGKLHQSKDDQLTMHLREAQKILRDTQQEMTNLIFPLRQIPLENQDLADALAEYLSKWSHQYGIFIKFTTEIQGQEKNFFLPAHIKEAFFRVAQEALSNAARHSNSSCIQVTLTIGWLYIILKISDNGQGFDLHKQKRQGIGLSCMRERMEAIHGDLQVCSTPLQGTEVIATYKQPDTEPNIAMLITPHVVSRDALSRSREVCRSRIPFGASLGDL